VLDASACRLGKPSKRRFGAMGCTQARPETAESVVVRRSTRWFSPGLLAGVEHIFFDCDDTLYQNDWATAELLKASIDRYATEELGLPENVAFELYKEHGTALRGLLKENHLSEDLVEHFLEDVHNVPLDDIGPRPKLRRIIESLRHRHLWVFTASIREHAERCLERLGISDLFEGIIDCRDVGLITKHSPAAFLVAMEKAHVTEPRKCLFFDDSVKNIRTAKEIGWITCSVGRERGTGKPLNCEHADFALDFVEELPWRIPGIFENPKKLQKELEYIEEEPQDEEVNKVHRNVLFVLGGPGTGKGTQSQMLKNDRDIVHLSVGDLLRDEQTDPTSKYGNIIREAISEGGLVPAEITMKIIVEAFKKCPDAENFLIDGCPRDILNYEAWKSIIEEPGHAHVVGVLYYEADEDVMLERILSRAAASDGNVRVDDNVETAKKRFRTYRERTMPLIEQLKEEGLVWTIDAARGVEEIFDDTLNAVDSILGQSM